MHRPPHDFRDHFKRVVERTVHGTRQSIRFVRDDLDFDEFMSSESPKCASPKTLALAFMTKYFSIYLHPALADAFYLAIVQYLAEISGRNQVNDGDIRALRELKTVEHKTERELGHWLDSYFSHVR